MAHSTATPEATAIDIQKYEYRTWRLGSAANARFIHVELCETSDSLKFIRSYERYIEKTISNRDGFFSAIFLMLYILQLVLQLLNKTFLQHSFYHKTVDQAYDKSSRLYYFYYL